MVMGDDVDMEAEDIIETLRKKFARVAPVLDERGRRCGRRRKRKPWVWWARSGRESDGASPNHALPGRGQAGEGSPALGGADSAVGVGASSLTIHQPELRSPWRRWWTRRPEAIPKTRCAGRA